MPDESQHLQFWTADAHLSERLERDSEYGWSITTMFYSALHLVDAVLGRTGVHPNTHGARQRAIREHPLLAAHWAAYRVLEDLSRDARYNCITFTAPAVTEARANYFAPLEMALRGHLEQR